MCLNDARLYGDLAHPVTRRTVPNFDPEDVPDNAPKSPTRDRRVSASEVYAGGQTDRVSTWVRDVRRSRPSPVVARP